MIKLFHIFYCYDASIGYSDNVFEMCSISINYSLFYSIYIPYAYQIGVHAMVISGSLGEYTAQQWHQIKLL